MYSHHVLAALATERRNTFLAEAESFRLARQGRWSRQRAGGTTTRHWALHWALRLVAVRPKPPALTTDQPSELEA
jgi:hypothetical protein